MASNIATFLGNASTENIVVDAVLGKAKGTYFKTETPSINLNQKKKWIAFHSRPRGEIIIDQLAKKRIIANQQSLLPSGIHQVKGLFEKGAVIRIIDTYGIEIGCGIVNFSTEELLKLTKIRSDIEIDPPSVMDINLFVCYSDVPITV